MLRLFATALLLAPLAAQDVRPQPRPAAPEPAADNPLRLYDFVVAMVGDKAILASQVTEVWRNRVQSRRDVESASRRNLLWYDTVELFVGRELQAQSARLMGGRSPEEVDAHVERLVQEELRRKYEESGGLNEYVRQLGVVGSSMNSVAEEERTRILYSIVHHQGVLRELQDQQALLATPKEMQRRFLENPRRFEVAGAAKVAARRFTAQGDPAAATAEAEKTAAEWRALPRPLTAEAVQAAGGQILDVTFRDPPSPLLEFAASAQVGEVSAPRADGPSIWVLALLAKTDPQPARFDAQVQAQLAKEIAAERRQEIYENLFQEQRIGVDRLPWGEPAQMENPKAPARRR